MKLSDIFSQLSYGELSQLALVDATTGLIDPAKYAPLVAHVNLGLTALYKRFPLKENRLSFALQASRVSYPLSTQGDVNFLDNGSGEDFNDDILKIEQVLTSNGVVLSLNDASDPYSCFTPSSTTLRVPLAMVTTAGALPPRMMTNALQVVYRANHPIIVYSGANFAPSRIEVELPYSHLEPLLLFVASRVNNPIGMSNEFHAGNSYAAKYEAACARLENDGLEVDQGSQGNRLQQSGWV